MLKATSFLSVSIAAVIGLFSSPVAADCALRPEYNYISLSAPTTSLLEEISLLEDPALAGVSALHEVENPKVKKIAGGVFLSSKALKRPEISVVFYDESRELERALKQFKVKAASEVKTRGLDPFEARDAAKQALLPHLLNCKERLKKADAKIAAILAQVREISFGTNPYIFYLGKLAKGQRPPELVMANDGFVSFLRARGMQSYPGSLPYIPWSKRIIDKLDAPILIGLVEGKSERLKVEKVGPRMFNLSKKNFLSPGGNQILFLKDLKDSGFFERAGREE